jgi:two-component system response regulator DesR
MATTITFEDPVVLTADSKKLRAVIVDDSAQMVLYLGALLGTMQGVEVVGTATDGSNALLQVEALRPDLVLMDLQMPGMDGLEATRRLRERFPAIAVLVVTGLDTAEARRESLKAGAVGFVSKHRLKQELSAEIARLTGSSC